jgi:hypothetical protein
MDLKALQRSYLYRKLGVIQENLEWNIIFLMRIFVVTPLALMRMVDIKTLDESNRFIRASTAENRYIDKMPKRESPVLSKIARNLEIYMHLLAVVGTSSTIVSKHKT